jgi:tetratricopeptide (TPR) repeat protein
MYRRLAYTTIFVLVVCLGTFAQKLGPPNLDPTPETPAQKALISEGVALHDKADYDGAISRYQQVLKENPNSVHALYEMSYSYYAKKDYQRSIEVGYKVAEYKSELLAAIYVQIGSCFDELGDSKRAIETYKAGIKLDPNNGLLYYNLAVTCVRTGQADDARTAVKKAVMLAPEHRSSHLLLSGIFDKAGYKIPGLLAALRFLVLEPNSTRSETALRAVQKTMNSGVSRGSETQINIFVEQQSKKDEGDFEPVDLFLKLAKASNLTEEKKNKSEMELLVDNFQAFFAVLSEVDSTMKCNFEING